MVTERKAGIRALLKGIEYVEHNPGLRDGLGALRDALSTCEADGAKRVQYQHTHRLLAEGNFVLSVNEGLRDGVQTAFYGLFRIDADRIVEH